MDVDSERCMYTNHIVVYRTEPGVLWLRAVRYEKNFHGYKRLGTIYHFFNAKFTI